jgi:uncharacterized protein YbcV (DUF1398 family)
MTLCCYPVAWHIKFKAMFTEQQIKEAHSRVKTGADFPRYIQDIKKLGLVTYEYLVEDGTTVYHGENSYEVRSASRYSPLIITDTSSAATLRHTISIHQQGQTDFMTFCHQAADAGVEKWVIDTKKMLCTYYDKQGNNMVAEPIPQGDYE